MTTEIYLLEKNNGFDLVLENILNNGKYNLYIDSPASDFTGAIHGLTAQDLVTIVQNLLDEIKNYYDRIEENLNANKD